MDIAKIEQLVSMYIELDEEDQKTIFDKTAVLFHSRSIKNQVVKENNLLPTKKRRKEHELEEAITEKVYDRFTKMKDMLDIFDNTSTDVQAAMLMLAHTIGNKSSNVTETEVKVTISYHSKAMKEYVEELVPGVNYENAYRLYQEMLSEAKQKMNSIQSVP